MITKNVFNNNKTNDSSKNCYHIRLQMLLTKANLHNLFIIVTCLITAYNIILNFNSGPKLPPLTKVTPVYGNILPQIVRRLSEENAIQIVPINKNMSNNSFKLENEHDKGILINNTYNP